MKRNILLFAALSIFAVTGVQAQSKAKSTAKKVETTSKVQGPGVVFSSETIDYGTVAQNSDGVKEFTFVNNGTAPLVIKSASGSCGCTVPTYSKEPIMPGLSGSIKVSYDTSRIGAFQKTVTITTNASEEKKVLTIKGNVLAAAGSAKS